MIGIQFLTVIQIKQNSHKMNELSHGQQVRVPLGVVRSVSFQKIRQGSLTTKDRHGKENKKIQPSKYQELISSKLHQKINENPNKRTSETQNQKQALKRQLEEKQMKQCTFQPNINKRGSFTRRTIQEFLEQQAVFEKQKEDKVKQMREYLEAKKESQNIFRPNSYRGQAQKHDPYVHQRLYEEGLSKMTSREQTVYNSVERNQNSKPKSNKKLSTVSRQTSSIKSFAAHSNIQSYQSSAFTSSVPISSYPSKETTNANQKQNNMQRNSSNKSLRSNRGLSITRKMDVQEVCERKLRGQKPQYLQSKQQNKKTAQKNKQIYVKKVLREIGYVLAQLKLDKMELNYTQMGQMFHRMNFVETQDLQQTSQRRNYLSQLWQMLQGDVYEKVHLNSLVKVIFSLLGCHDCSIIETHLRAALPEQPTRSLVLTEKDSKVLKSNFEQLALNRLKKGQCSTHENKSQEYTFKPFVSKNSSTMAENYRKKVLEESENLINNNLIKYDVGQDGFVDHVDLLFLDEKRKQLRLQKQRQEQKRQKKIEQEQSMRPQRQKSHKKHNDKHNMEGTDPHKDRFSELYEMGKNHIRSRKQKTDPPIRFSEQCTFQPNQGRQRGPSHSRETSILKDQYSRASHSASEEVRDFDKSVFRMYEARRLRETSQNKTQRSMLTDRQSMLMMNSQDQMSPLLYLNVNVEENEDVKIPVYHSDNMRSITHKVRQMAGLMDADQQKLQEILRFQIVPALQQYGILSDAE